MMWACRSRPCRPTDLVAVLAAFGPLWGGVASVYDSKRDPRRKSIAEAGYQQSSSRLQGVIADSSYPTLPRLGIEFLSLPHLLNLLYLYTHRLNHLTIFIPLHKLHTLIFVIALYLSGYIFSVYESLHTHSFFLA